VPLSYAPYKQDQPNLATLNPYQSGKMRNVSNRLQYFRPRDKDSVRSYYKKGTRSEPQSRGMKICSKIVEHRRLEQKELLSEMQTPKLFKSLVREEHVANMSKGTYILQLRRSLNFRLSNQDGYTINVYYIKKLRFY
jgi:hypothetical protein